MPTVLNMTNAIFLMIKFALHPFRVLSWDISLPGVAPFGLTPGCTLARFQRAKNEY